MTAKKQLVLSFLLVTLMGCSVKNAYMYPQAIQNKYVITTGDIDEPYESLGYIQITKTGATLFGYVDVLDANLQGIFEDALLDEIEGAGADGIINLHFHETQYTPLTRALFAFPLFFVPLPNIVEISGELVKLKES